MISLLEYKLYSKIKRHKYGPYDYKQTMEQWEKNDLISRAYGAMNYCKGRRHYIDVYNEDHHVAIIMWNESKRVKEYDAKDFSMIVKAIDDTIAKYERGMEYDLEIHVL